MYRLEVFSTGFFPDGLQVAGQSQGLIPSSISSVQRDNVEQSFLLVDGNTAALKDKALNRSAHVLNANLITTKPPISFTQGPFFFMLRG